MIPVLTMSLALALAGDVPGTEPHTAVATERNPYVIVQEAKAALDRGEFESVLDLVDPLLVRYPRSHSSHLLRGLALDGIGRLDEAEVAYRAAVEISPDDPQIRSLFASHYLRRKRWSLAIRELEKSLETEPAAEGFVLLSKARLQVHDKVGAHAAIERAAELAPDSATILVELGESRAKAGDHPAALEALLRAQARNPAEPGLDLALGVVHLGLLDVEKARASLERSLAQQPANPAVLATLASACAKARDHSAARRYYLELLGLGRDDAETRLGLGVALLGLGENEAAIRELTSATKRNPRLAEAYFHLSQALRVAGREEESQRAMRTLQALKSNPFKVLDQRSELERSLWNRAEAFLDAGQESQALELLSASEVPGLHPSYLVGALYSKLGRPADAERLFRQALQLAPTLPRLRAHLGLALLTQGRLPEAETLIREDYAQNPREPFVLMAAGQLAHARKEWAEAVRCLGESRVAEPAVLLMLCEAQIENAQRAEALETARLIGTLAAGDPKTLGAIAGLLARHGLDSPAPASTLADSTARP